MLNTNNTPQVGIKPVCTTYNFDQGSCNVGGDGSKSVTSDIICGDASKEFSALPVNALIPYVTTGQDTNTYYLDYYQSIFGTDPTNQSTIGGLVVEPLGANCYEIYNLGGLDNFWRSARFLNVSLLSRLSISQACPIRDCTFVKGVYFGGGSMGTADADAVTIPNEAACCCFSCDTSGTTAADFKNPNYWLSYTSGGFCSDIVVSQGFFDFGGQQQFLAKDCVAPAPTDTGTSASGAYTGGSWAITLLNCKTGSTGSTILDSGSNNGIFNFVKDPSFPTGTCPKISVTINTTGSSPFTINSITSGGSSISTANQVVVPNADGTWLDITNTLKTTTSDTVILPAGRYKITSAVDFSGKNLLGYGMAIVQLGDQITFANGFVYSIIFDVYGNFDGKNVITFGQKVQSFDLSVRCGGYSDSDAAKSDNAKPTVLVSVQNQGCVLRVSGDSCYLENTWIWRADHTRPDTSEFWDQKYNPADHGIIIDGNGVIAAGLQVEHFDKENIIWNGNDGKLCMFQNEIPYYGSSFDTPVFVINGRGFIGYSFGIYCYFKNSVVTVDHAIRITSNANDAKINGCFTKWLNGTTGSKISHIIYDENSKSYYGDGVSDTNKGSAAMYMFDSTSLPTDKTVTKPTNPLTAWAAIPPTPPTTTTTTSPPDTPPPATKNSLVLFISITLGILLFSFIVIILWRLISGKGLFGPKKMVFY